MRGEGKYSFQYNHVYALYTPLVVILLLAVNVVIEHIRCGNDSGQCIYIVDRCNHIKDCFNGWDEDATLCYTEFERANFAAEGIITSIKYI